MKTVRLRSKKWELPEVLPMDENAPYYFWQEIDFRKPLSCKKNNMGIGDVKWRKFF